MAGDDLTRSLEAALADIPLIDPHSHIDPHRPGLQVARRHPRLPLLHRAGPLGRHEPGAARRRTSPARDRVRAIVGHMGRFDNTAQYAWFVEIARTFLGFTGERVTAADADTAVRRRREDVRPAGLGEAGLREDEARSDLPDQRVRRPAGRLRHERSTSPACGLTRSSSTSTSRRPRQRLAKATGVEVGDAESLRKAVWKLFARFKAKGAKACAISLPPDFAPVRVPDVEFDRAVQAVVKDSTIAKAVFGGMQFARSVIGGASPADASPQAAAALGVFWMLAEHCREFELPFDLMIGVNRRVYENGVYQGQDLFDRRTSLHPVPGAVQRLPGGNVPDLGADQRAEPGTGGLLVDLPERGAERALVVLEHPGVHPADLRERLQAVPKTKLIGYYSDAYKLEFVLPKYNMYRRVLAGVLADEFVRPGMMSETEAVALGKRLLRDNVRDVFKV